MISKATSLFMSINSLSGLRIGFDRWDDLSDSSRVRRAVRWRAHSDSVTTSSSSVLASATDINCVASGTIRSGHAHRGSGICERWALHIGAGRMSATSRGRHLDLDLDLDTSNPGYAKGGHGQAPRATGIVRTCSCTESLGQFPEITSALWRTATRTKPLLLKRCNRRLFTWRS